MLQQTRVMTIPNILSVRHRAPAAAAVSLGWWDGNATIAQANVLEYVENPSARQLYAGSAVAAGQPWTIAAKTSDVAGYVGAFMFDSQSGRVVCGTSNATQRGFFAASAWTNIDLFLIGSGSIVVYLISTGSQIQAYRNNVAVGSAVTASEGLHTSGVTRWRSRYVDSAGNWFEWANAVPRAAVYNVALSSAQRAALYTSMSA